MTESAPADRRTFTTAVRDLAAAQKRSAGVPAYLRYVNRPLGRIAAAVAYVVGMTPNGVTLLSGAASLASLVALSTVEPSWWLGIAVAFGLVVGYALDSADGQLARLLGGGSLAGEWLDHVVDAARMPALHIAVLIALYRFHDDLAPALLLVPLGFLLVTVVRFYSQNIAELMRRYHPHITGGADSTSTSAARSLIALPGDFGLLCIVFVLWGHPGVFLTGYGLLFATNALLLFAGLRRRYRELAAARG